MKPFTHLYLVACLAACGGETEPPKPADTAEVAADAAEAKAPPNPYAGALVFSGATLWDGTGAGVLENAVVIVRDGRIAEISAGAPPDGAQVIDLAGTWVVPGFIDAHAHVSGYWAPDEVSDVAQRIRNELALYARYGVTTVNSLGGEPMEAMSVRDAQNSAALSHARVYVAGQVIEDTDPLAAAKTTAANVLAGVDWLKIRVDDNLGTAEKMPWPAIEAVFQTANARDARVATHVFYKDDASRLLDLGTDLIAHSVRDQPLDDPFVAKLYESGVCYVPTLTREMSTFVYSTRPDFFDDPFFA
jgi:imidazolonepropionase-like amidohydrolase